MSHFLSCQKNYEIKRVCDLRLTLFTIVTHICLPVFVCLKANKAKRFKGFRWKAGRTDFKETAGEYVLGSRLHRGLVFLFC